MINVPGISIFCYFFKEIVEDKTRPLLSFIDLGQKQNIGESGASCYPFS